MSSAPCWTMSSQNAILQRGSHDARFWIVKEIKMPSPRAVNLVIFGLLIACYVGRHGVVRGEGAGSSLGDVAQCMLRMEELHEARVGFVNGTDPVIQFNRTFYGENRTHYLLTLPSTSNGTVSLDSSVIIGDQLMASDEDGESSIFITQDKAAALLDIADAAAAREGLEGDVLEQSLENLELGSDVQIVIDAARDPFAVVPIEADTVRLSSTTLKDALYEGGEYGERVELIGEDVMRLLFPESCVHLGLELNASSAETVADDTITTVTVDDEGNELLTTCITTIKSLENQTMRVHVMGDETEAYIRSDGSLGGYVGQTFDRIRGGVSRLTFEYKNLTLDALKEYPMSPWSACIWDIHMGRLDVCLGEFYDTPERREMTEMSALLYLRNVGLVAQKTRSEINYSGLLQPFTPELWGCIIAVVVVFALLLWLFSYKRETADFGEDFSEGKRLGHSFHISIQSLMGAALVNDLGEPSNAIYWISSGYAIFVMVVIAAYTANLAAMLTAQRTGGSYNNIQEMVAAGHQVCVPQALVARVKVSVGESVPMLEVATVQEALDDIDLGKCAGAIIQLDAMNFASDSHCASKIIIEDSLFSIPTSIPVRMRYEGLVSKHVSMLRERGVIASYYSSMLESLSPGTCGTLSGGGEEEEENLSLSAVNAMPLFVFVGCLFLVGCIVYAWEVIAKHRKDAAEQALKAQKNGNTSPSHSDFSSEYTSGRPSFYIDVATAEEKGKKDALSAVMEQLQAMQENQQRMQAEMRSQLQSMQDQITGSISAVSNDASRDEGSY